MLRTLRALAPEGVEAVIYEGLVTLPHFNPDDDVEPLPGPVAELRAQVDAASAVVFCTPEYAGALPGSLKNLLDWSVGGVEMYEKPVAWTNASTRQAAHAHGSLRTVLGYISAEIVEDACVHVPVPRQSVESLGDDVEPSLPDEPSPLEDVSPPDRNVWSAGLAGAAGAE